MTYECFWTNPRAEEMYRNHMLKVVSRVNTVNGRLWRYGPPLAAKPGRTGRAASVQEPSMTLCLCLRHGPRLLALGMWNAWRSARAAPAQGRSRHLRDQPDERAALRVPPDAHPAARQLLRAAQLPGAAGPRAAPGVRRDRARTCSGLGLHMHSRPWSLRARAGRPRAPDRVGLRRLTLTLKSARRRAEHVPGRDQRVGGPYERVPAQH